MQFTLNLYQNIIFLKKHAIDVCSYGILLWKMYSFGLQPYDGMTGAEVVKFFDIKHRLLRS